MEAVTEAGRGPLVVLPLLHGPMGEDGTIQGLLEIAGVPYCGAGVAGSAVAMDKGLAKALLAAAGLPHARFLSIREGDIGADLAQDVEAVLGWPVFVKPANMGSSIGVSRVNDAGRTRTPPSTWPGATTSSSSSRRRCGAGSWRSGSWAGRTCGHQSPGEVIPSHDFYDFEDKYVDGAAGLEVPARLPAGVADEMARLAVAACQALRVDCMARVDFFFEEGGRGLLINEVNTIPGFTPISMYPRLWEASGLPIRRWSTSWSPRPAGVRGAGPGSRRTACKPGRSAPLAAGRHAMTPATTPPGGFGYARPITRWRHPDSCPWPLTPAAPAAGRHPQWP